MKRITECKRMLVMIATAFVLVVAIYIATETKQPIQKQNMVTVDTVIYGREKEQNYLLDKILSQKHSVIEIIGIVGVGKTAFVLNTTDKLTTKHNYCHIYIDLSHDDINYDVSSLIIHQINQKECMNIEGKWMSALSSVFLTFKRFFQHPNQIFQHWYDKLQTNTILTLDHADHFLDELQKKIIQPLLTLNSKSVVVLLISRVSNREYLKRAMIPLAGIESRQCAIWINLKYEHVNFYEGEQLCQELGGVPSDVIDAVELVKHPFTSQSTGDVISGLKNREYGQAFRYLESILGRHYKDTREHNIAMYVHYNRLSFEHRECIWLLVEITENGEFTKDMAEKHLQQNVDGCLDTLLMNSFLQAIQTPHKRFQFRSNVIKFIQSIGQPTPYIEDVRTKVWTFYGNYVSYNARNLYSKLKTTHDVQLAVSIGSNRELVNSLVPLLGEKCGHLINVSLPFCNLGEKYDLRPLFKISLEVIEESYCSSNSEYNRSNANALLAFSYLTKAVHCPSIHPPAMLSSRQKMVSKPDTCLKQLIRCPAILSLNTNTYEAAEALGYHNSLLIYASNNSLPTVPWSLSFVDVSMIVTVANRECVKFCKSDGYCQCGKPSSIEHGLRQFLLRNYAVSSKYFQSVLYQLSHNDHQCQTILKILAIIGIDSANRSSHNAVDIHLNMNIDFGNLNFSCFLGILNDVIIPYLVDIKHKESQKLLIKLNKIVSEVDEQCNMEATTDEERLDCTPRIRYTIAHGLTALKMTELQDNLRWPQEVTEYASREEWVCSVIRDKTTRCKETLPLFSQVRSIETNKNYEPLWSMQYFLEQAEYAQIDKKARAIPRLFQLMSI